ncbi:sulfoquinovose isomerase [Mobiluncus mulieris]|uniref:Uncharacterized sugar isomerase yihS n=1 Tax=Mobiluncus mulieris TaxID=2052 RepID=A0A8G2M4P0_9ACTO|nr:AGE family epimerase/isomerase [Mobiluncus mulieris]MBB5845841.1 sulfoquinovose isomerase [Mobiluncus mulieris]STO15500.1 Uncharacterized sugar isomerase yihS [Mobiluncus mulieris]
MMLDRESEISNLLKFAVNSRHKFGFAWLDDEGRIDTKKHLELWITARMTHCFALGSMLHKLLPESECAQYRELAIHGISCLCNYFHDVDYGGYFSAISSTTGVASGRGERKEAYSHAFVILAASSAVIAGVNEAEILLEDALQVSTERWWDKQSCMVKESYTRDFTECEPYRGLNAAMHTVEAYLAAFDALEKLEYLNRAKHMVEHVVGEMASASDWRLCEHFSISYEPLYDFNKDKPGDAFRPYGATPGHSFEWGRLALQTVVTCRNLGIEISESVLGNALRLIDAGKRDGWCRDGAPGYVYTVDFDGTPVNHSRMYWVACEAVVAACVAQKLDTVNHLKWEHLEREAMNFLETYCRDQPGRYVHELDESNKPAFSTWSGKPDIYHTLQAMLIDKLPASPTFALAVRGIFER